MDALRLFLTEFVSSLTGRLLLGALFITYGISLTGYFLFPDYNDHYRFFVRFVVFPGVFFIVAGYLKVAGNGLFRLILVYMLYMLASGLWSQPFGLYKFGQMIGTSVYIVAFIVLTHYFHLKYPAGFERLLKLSAIIAAISIPVALISWYSDHSFPETRVAGLGSLTNVNEFANVYGVFGLLAAGWVLKASSISEKFVFVLVVILTVVFMWFGQTRTALASLLIALVVLAVSGSREHKVLIGGVLVTSFTVLIVAFPGVIEVVWARGAHWRPLIWQEVLSQIAEAPVFGHGIITPAHYVADAEREFALSHNAYLQTIWHGGIVGAGLLLTMFIAAFHGAWKAGRETGSYVIFSLFVFASLCMITGVDMLIGRPREQWMLFWFPLTLLISYQLDHNQGGSEGDSFSD